jgi:hypothetical protein
MFSTLVSAPSTSCPWPLLPHILLADIISCTPNEDIISLLIGMVDNLHAQYNYFNSKVLNRQRAELWDEHSKVSAKFFNHLVC